MTSVQKVIKYLAIVFAIFLSVSIICGILSGGYLVLKSTGIMKFAEVKETKLLEELVTISDNNEVITSLELKIKVSNLKIVSGEKFEVKTNNPDITFSNNNGSVIIEEPDRNILPNTDSNVIIYIPNELDTLDKIKIESGVGKVYIDSLNTKLLDLELGIGETMIDNIIVFEKAKIEGGMGKLSINSSSINNANIDLGVGETCLTGDILGNSEINTGIGKLDLNLNMNEQSYKIKVEKGIGNINYNGNNVPNDTILGNGENYISIEGGIGSINIKANNI